MVNLLLKWVLGALALLAVTYIVPGFRVVSLPSALVAVLVIGFLNMTLGLLLKVITFPFAILTLGLLFLVINALMLILASKITPGLQIASFGARLLLVGDAFQQLRLAGETRGNRRGQLRQAIFIVLHSSQVPAVGVTNRTPR